MNSNFTEKEYSFLRRAFIEKGESEKCEHDFYPMNPNGKTECKKCGGKLDTFDLVTGIKSHRTTLQNYSGQIK